MLFLKNQYIGFFIEDMSSYKSGVGQYYTTKGIRVYKDYDVI